ncbi:hypothetical protein O9H85_02495 [Paenibacillus filicis]|uniref:Class I SAM-dependent methyltransferase n=1 Tax=Paenibacillus gyeongsangnamensis TaxID=3388067 RepID=A0ABT4Q373_9BACL|nr:hypothetical protein [Paenibacillus filicis]MCZ8511323.1 hypothetical protein [Paenibacillus filicis]
MRDYGWIPAGLGRGLNPSGEQALDWGEHEFATHRYQVRRLIEQSVELLGIPEKAAVLGAGNHGDVNLPGLAAQFQQVTVIDSEDNAVDEWAESAGGFIASRIKSMNRIDYTALDQVQYYEEFEELLANQASASALSSFLRDCAFRVRRHEALSYLKSAFSLVVSSGVHTQLFYVDALERFAGYASQYSEQEIRQIMEAMSYLRNSLITDYNQLLVRMVKAEGRIVLWTDVVLLDEKTRWVADELYSIPTEKERTAFLFQSFGKYGMEAAVWGLKDMHERLRPEQLQFHSWIWHTESGKSYLTAGLSGRPKS